MFVFNFQHWTNLRTHVYTDCISRSGSLNALRVGLGFTKLLGTELIIRQWPLVVGPLDGYCWCRQSVCHAIVDHKPSSNNNARKKMTWSHARALQATGVLIIDFFVVVAHSSRAYHDKTIRQGGDFRNAEVFLSWLPPGTLWGSRGFFFKYFPCCHFPVLRPDNNFGFHNSGVKPLIFLPAFSDAKNIFSQSIGLNLRRGTPRGNTATRTTRWRWMR